MLATIQIGRPGNATAAYNVLAALPLIPFMKRVRTEQNERARETRPGRAAPGRGGLTGDGDFPDQTSVQGSPSCLGIDQARHCCTEQPIRGLDELIRDRPLSGFEIGRLSVE